MCIYMYIFFSLGVMYVYVSTFVCMFVCMSVSNLKDFRSLIAINSTKHGGPNIYEHTKSKLCRQYSILHVQMFMFSFQNICDS